MRIRHSRIRNMEGIHIHNLHNLHNLRNLRNLHIHKVRCHKV
jgi:hypothetical protein